MPHAPIDERFIKVMNDLAADLDHLFNGGLKGEDRRIGFLLCVYPFGALSRFNYISNSERASVIDLLHEVLDRFEKEKEAANGGHSGTVA